MASKLENNKVAARYARALFDTVGGELDAVYTDLVQADQVFHAVPELLMFMENPGIPLAEKQALVKKQFDGLNPWVGKLLLLLVENGRVAALPMIVTHLRELINRRDNVTQAEVVTATELDQELRERIRMTLEKNLGFNRVELNSRVDPGILGGLIIKVRDRIIDGSYVGRLEDLRKQVAKV